MEPIVTKSLTELANETRGDIIDFAKREYSSHPDTPELGDYIPFMIRFGEEEWAREQISMASGELTKPAAPFYREDTVLGLIEYYRLTGDEQAIEYTEQYFDFLFANYVRDDRIVTTYLRQLQHEMGYARKNVDSRAVRAIAGVVETLLYPVRNVRVPPYRTFPKNGMFIEMLVDTYELTGSDTHLKRAERLADYWLSLDTFREYGLFPRPHVLPWRGPTADIAKGNSGVVHGLLALLDVTGEDRYAEAIDRWTDGVEQYCLDDGLYGRYAFQTGKRDNKELWFSFPCIDIFCRAYDLTGRDRYLSLAEEIAAFWLDRQAETGLVPHHADGTASHIDSMTDFIVSLWRLAELTGDDMYRTRAENAMRGLFTHHRFPLLVDVHDGTVVDSTVTPRFVTLMPKAILLLEIDTIYGSRTNLKLLRDR